ncbi:unnamed protein product [Urochloa humidicola]
MGEGKEVGGSPAAATGGEMAGPAGSWRLNVSDFHMPERPKEPPFVTRVFLRSHGMLHPPCFFPQLICSSDPLPAPLLLFCIACAIYWRDCFSMPCITAAFLDS